MHTPDTTIIVNREPSYGYAEWGPEELAREHADLTRRLSALPEGTEGAKDLRRDLAHLTFEMMQASQEGPQADVEIA